MERSKRARYYQPGLASCEELVHGRHKATLLPTDRYSLQVPVHSSCMVLMSGPITETAISHRGVMSSKHMIFSVCWWRNGASMGGF